MREYEIDAEAGALVPIYSAKTAHYAEYGGQAQPYGEWILWQHGTAGRIEVLTRSGEVRWAVDWAEHLTGNVSPIADLYALTHGW